MNDASDNDLTRCKHENYTTLAPRPINKSGELFWLVLSVFETETKTNSERIERVVELQVSRTYHILNFEILDGVFIDVCVNECSKQLLFAVVVLFVGVCSSYYVDSCGSEDTKTAPFGEIDEQSVTAPSTVFYILYPSVSANSGSSATAAKSSSISRSPDATMLATVMSWRSVTRESTLCTCLYCGMRRGVSSNGGVLSTPVLVDPSFEPV